MGKAIWISDRAILTLDHTRMHPSIVLVEQHWFLIYGYFFLSTNETLSPRDTRLSPQWAENVSWWMNRNFYGIYISWSIWRVTTKWQSHNRGFHLENFVPSSFNFYSIFFVLGLISSYNALIKTRTSETRACCYIKAMLNVSFSTILFFLNTLFVTLDLCLLARTITRVV